MKIIQDDRLKDAEVFYPIKCCARGMCGREKGSVPFDADAETPFAGVAHAEHNHPVQVFGVPRAKQIYGLVNMESRMPEMKRIKQTRLAGTAMLFEV